jgi:uncharacterized protein
MTVSIALAVGLLAWSLLGNLLLGETLYVTRNVVLGILVVVMLRRAGIGWPALGVDAAHLRAGLRWGGVAALVVAVAVVVGLLLADHVPGLDVLLSDERANLSGPLLAWHALWRIPIGTALFEELVFRGALLGALMLHTSPWRAVLISSVVFGLWHVAPTIVTLQVNGVAVGSVEGLGAIVGAVAVTTVAGIAFSALRLGAGSLVAPVLAHWATNSTGLLAAAVAQGEA